MFDICHIATFPYSHRSPHFTQMLRMHLYYLFVLLVYLQKSIKLSLIYWLLISECITFFSFRDFTLEITWFTSAVTRPFTSAASLMTRLHLPPPPPLPPPLPSAPPPPSPLFPLPPQQTKVSLNLVSWALFFALPRMFYILRNVLKPERRHFLISVLIILQLPIKNVCKHLLTWKLLPLILMVCSSSWF